MKALTVKEVEAVNGGLLKGPQCAQAMLDGADFGALFGAFFGFDGAMVGYIVGGAIAAKTSSACQG